VVSIIAPAGAAASVVVTGPQGYTKTVTSTTTLTGVPIGTYALTAATVVGTDSIVGTAYAGMVSGSPASVSASGTATVTVTYSARGGTGALWLVGGLPYANGSVQSAALAYGAAQLRTGSGSPSVTLSFPSTLGGNINASAVAVDSAGNLWVANQNTHAVVKYTPDALAATGAPTPAATVTMADSSGTVALAFDPKGNLWVVNQWAGTINEFTPAQLVSGTPTPVVTIQDGLHGSYSNQTGNNPIAIAFDSAGNLWIANTNDNVIEYAANQLTSSGSPAPAVTLSPGTPASIADTAFNTPYALAFDHQGNLWVAMAAGSFFEFPPSVLTVSGVPTARMKLTPPQSPGQTPFPVAVAFDNSGNLWFGMLAGLSIGEYTAAQIAAGGNPAPAVTIKLSGSLSPTAIAFDPHSTSLPLH
jgi:hypothetical protein